MKLSCALRTATAAFLSLTLISCTSASHRAIADAGRATGAIAAGISIEPQPEECGQRWPDLVARDGEDARSFGRRYVDYVRGPINDRQQRCFDFNANIAIGLMGLAK